MFKDFLNRVEFKTKKIQSSTILKNFNESINKNMNNMITKNILSLNIQIRDYKKTIIFKMISTMKNLYLKQS